MAFPYNRRGSGRTDDLSLEEGYRPDDGSYGGDRAPRDFSGNDRTLQPIIGDELANSRSLWAVVAFVFCYFAAVLPIWRFALPINYVASYIVFLGFLRNHRGFVLHPDSTLPAYTSFSDQDWPLWPIMFVTIACGAISGWHSIVSSSGTARQLESEMDARPVGGGVMFVEMMLAVFALIIAGHDYAPAEYGAAIAKGPGAIFAGGWRRFWEPSAFRRVGERYGSVMMVVLAVTIMQLVDPVHEGCNVRVLSDVSPIFKNAHVGTFIASILGMILVLTGWWQYLWVLFGGANQLDGVAGADAYYRLAHVRRESRRPGHSIP